MQESVLISHDRLLEILSYDPETGIFVRKVRTTNSIHIGDRAGSQRNSHRQKYRMIKIDGRLYREHRLAWYYMTGKWPYNDIDHIDRNQSNNKFKNLREASKKQNNGNSSIAKNNTSGAKGVVVRKRKDGSICYDVYIGVDGKRLNLGRRNTLDEAKAVYDKAALAVFGEFATDGLPKS